MKPTDLGTAIVQALEQYTDDVARGVEIEVDSMAKVVERDIEKGSPVKSGDYKRGWAIRKANRPGVAVRLIHNRTHYQLVHLLEKGHALRNGGRAKAIPHVGPVCDQRLPEFEDRVRRVVANGGPL